MSARIRQAVVLAGGRGTRLGGLTEATPKPLLPVAGRPFVEWLLGNLERHGLEEVVLTVGYRAEAFGEWRAGLATPLCVDVLVEEEPLGTAGALALMGERLHDAFFALNGDTLFDAPLTELEELRRSTGAAAAVALRSVPDTGRYGRATLDGARVTGFAEKAASGPGLVNGGVYALTRAALEGLGSPSSVEVDLLPALAAEGRLAGMASDGFFIDIGVPETYATAQSSVPAWWEGS